MASYNDIRNLKRTLLDLWATHFFCFPSGDSKELEQYVEGLKRSHPDESGGELLARIKKSSGPLFHAAGENSKADLFEIVDLLEKKRGGAARVFRVVHKPRIALRAQPNTTAPMVCGKRFGDRLAALDVRDGWIKTRDGKRDGWGLIDGAALGLGKLLEEEGGSSAPPASPPHSPKRAPSEGGFPKTYKVSGKKGALLRAKADLDSARVKPNLDSGQICLVMEETVLPCGTRRLHVVDPVDGWCSEKCMTGP